ncbi:Chitin synthase, class 3 [Stygiomarasmius scandens]|uniref:Chitin synthase, class 3 n=1 Tax=Marasmiellus scandens TaxID=2682957 RepID=A0ABR1J715_9AGAR
MQTIEERQESGSEEGEARREQPGGGSKEEKRWWWLKRKGRRANVTFLINKGHVLNENDGHLVLHASPIPNLRLSVDLPFRVQVQDTLLFKAQSAGTAGAQWNQQQRSNNTLGYNQDAEYGLDAGRVGRKSLVPPDCEKIEPGRPSTMALLYPCYTEEGSGRIGAMPSATGNASGLRRGRSLLAHSTLIAAFFDKLSPPAPSQPSCLSRTLSLPFTDLLLTLNTTSMTNATRDNITKLIDGK